MSGSGRVKQTTVLNALIDTRIASNQAGTNFETGDLGIGEATGAVAILRTLIKFDLTSIPAAADITSAILSLYIPNNPAYDASSNDATFAVYRVKRAWVENQANWSVYSAGNAWATAGGFHADDCEQTDIGSRNFVAAETLGEYKHFTLTPTTKTGLDLGDGWLIKATTESDNAYYFASSENATPGFRPYLTLEYF